MLYGLITWYVQKRYARKKSSASSITPKSGYIYAAHGSCAILTPLYFKHFDGHTEEIFLYCEEYIKAEHLKSKGLKAWYDESPPGCSDPRRRPEPAVLPIAPPPRRTRT